jgi:hypothetical protein
MRRLITTGIVLAALAFAGCGGGSGGSESVAGYSPELRANYLAACEDNSSSASCECTLSELESKIPEHDFKRAEARYALGEGFGPEFTDAMAEALASCS